MDKIQIGILGSTKGTTMMAIIAAISAKVIDARITVVISNKKNSIILERARINNIPDIYISGRGIDREYYDKQISEILIKYKVDIVLCIGWMRIFSPWFCRQWDRQLLNVHSSLLLKYAGAMDLNVHEMVLKNKETETGCTIHFIDETVDGGEILIQKICQITKNETTTSLKEKVQKLEGDAFIEILSNRVKYLHKSLK